MNAWLVDGIDNNEYTFNTVIVQPSIEAVREFKVLTGSFSAEFGRGAGVVSVSSKSGTNELHGNAFRIYTRNDRLDARNYFNPTSQAKPPYRRNQYGAAAGGPIVLPKIYNGKNRSFFFMDYFGMKERKGLTFVNTVPTSANRTGDFSAFTDTSGNLIKIYDPLTTRLNPAFDSSKPVSTTDAPAPAGSLHGKSHSQQPHQCGERECGQCLSAPKWAGEFQQLHIKHSAFGE